MNPLEAALLVFSFMALSHAFRWRMIKPLIDERQELKRIPSYTIGSGIILLGFLAWCMSTGDYRPFIVMAIMDFAGFLGAVAPRIVTRLDRAIEDARKKAEELEVYKKADDLARKSNEERDRTPRAD